MFSAVFNVLLGAGVKLLVNVVNFWLEQKRQNQLLLAARDEKMIDAMLANQKSQANNPFVQSTRRVLFLCLTLTLCYMMLYYATNPHIVYDVIVPRGEDTKYGLLSWITGSEDWVTVQLSGGLLLSAFVDLCFMVVGFYAVPSKMR